MRASRLPIGMTHGYLDELIARLRKTRTSYWIEPAKQVINAL